MEFSRFHATFRRVRAHRGIAAIRRFEDIEGWKTSRRLRQEFLRVAQERRFNDANLRSQLLDCADSAMSNIVEGFDSGTDPEFIRFLRIAYRSLSEFQSHLYAAPDQACLVQPSFDALYETARQSKAEIGGFIQYLRKPRK